jgi:hypothetical protein
LRPTRSTLGPNRAGIDAAIARGEPSRNISKRVSISPAGLLRHKAHVSVALAKITEKREEDLGDGLLSEIERIRQNAWRLVSDMESTGDLRGAVVALREVCKGLETQGKLVALASKAAEDGGPVAVKWLVEHIGAPNK